ncbi:MAG: 16S rRNA (cytidine(1402)-2'-O)-methyltransferase [Azospirillaceae bacterium]|nr:16S rRNA (cytidine(1402)-2'-O)-methyltransferase [Azospirillaceae bacterium]
MATPIGNAGDLSQRASTILSRVDIIYCEDTRVTRKLLTLHGIATATASYHEHNAAQVRPQIMARLAAGEAVALVSDAGTPLVSDPGYKLVQDCIAGGHALTALPGANAALTALILSGLPCDRFLFAGFLPPKSAARRTALIEFIGLRATLLFYESGPRLAAMLADLAAVLGPRRAAVARELTKLFEEVRRDTLDVLARHYEQAGPPKGEIVVVVGPPDTDRVEAADIDAALVAALNRLSLRDAVAEVAAATGWARRDVYAHALALTRDDPAGDDDDAHQTDEP